MLANTMRAGEKATAGRDRTHAPIPFAAGCDQLSEHPYGILKGVVDGNAFVAVG